jgi:glycosyltransferase involved in cell wall biosynthesis
MIGTIVDVVRGEGAASALRRANERMAEAAQKAVMRVRGRFARPPHTPLLNVACGGLLPRTGGVAIQLWTRLRAERALRSVAILHPSERRLLAPFTHEWRVAHDDFESAVRESMWITGARAIHLEGTSGVPLQGLLRMMRAGIPVVISVHDFSLFCSRLYLAEELDPSEQAERRTLAREILASAPGLIFPSQFLLDRHRELFSLPDLAAEVVEPAVDVAHRRILIDDERRGIAYAGSVKRHKGGQLLPAIAGALAACGRVLHIFGGGDYDLLRPLRDMPNVVVHGYYRHGTLPSLLAQHRIGLVVLPSIWPESFCTAMSEAWLGGACVAAFDIGAPAERIRRDGGGYLAPIESGAAGLNDIITRWISGAIRCEQTPRGITSPDDAAGAHCDLYRRWGLLS